MSDPIGNYIALLAQDAAVRKGLMPPRSARTRRHASHALIEAALEQPDPSPALQAALQPFLSFLKGPRTT